MGKKHDKQKSRRQEEEARQLKLVLDCLMGSEVQREEAIQFIKSLIFRSEADPHEAGPDPGVRLLAGTLDVWSQPKLAEKPKKQAELKKILDRILAGEAGWAFQELEAGLARITGIVAKGGVANADRLAAPLGAALEGVSAVIDDPEITLQADKLIALGQQGVDADYLESVSRFLGTVADRPPPPQVAPPPPPPPPPAEPEISPALMPEGMQEEQEAVKALVSGLAEQLRDVCLDAGWFDHQLDERLEEIGKADTLTDLRQVQEVLVGGVEGLKKNTDGMLEQLVETQKELVESREKLSRLEARNKGEKQPPQAGHDPVTGLPGRGMVDAFLIQELTLCSREGTPLGLIYFDLDTRVQIEAENGAAICQRVLASVAERCAQLVRDGDLLGRFEEDHFAFVLHGSNVGHGREIAEKMRHDIARLRFKTGGRHLEITGSFGVCAFQPGMMSAADFFQGAADALARARDQGGNRVEIAE